jgi:O-antigen ligase
MTSRVALTIPRTAGAIDLDATARWGLFAFAASLQFSIAIAQTLLAVTLLVWLALLRRGRTWPAAPRFFIPLLAYAGITLVAAAFSVDPLASVVDSKQLVLFLIVPAVYHIARGEHATRAVDVIVSMGAASAVIGLVQYGVLHYDDLGRRPQGALSHYMTYSGLLMLVLCAIVARLVFRSRDRVWPALVLPALVVALVLTLSRNAWIGACAGAGLLFLLRDLRLTALLPVILATLFVVAPGGIVDRLQSTFDAQDPANQDRFAMLEIGARIIRDHPMTGVGPNMVSSVYEQYRPDYAVNPTNLHLHNVPMQIAAERGLPALAMWIWFVVVLAGALLRQFRRQQDRVLAATGLAAVAAMLAAGLFEYNFGDSEFLMLFLVLVTLPFAAHRDAHPGATPHR